MTGPLDASTWIVAIRHEIAQPFAALKPVRCVPRTRTLKMVRKAQTHGHFDLQSYNMETITDVELAWCSSGDLHQTVSYSVRFP